MTTSALITMTQRKLHGYSRTEITEIYDEIQRMVYNCPVAFMRYKDSSTGLDPLLTTITDTLEYELTEAVIGADIAFVTNVYTEMSLHVPYDYKPYYPPLFASTRQALGKNFTKAKVLFNSNPGDSEYYVSCYRYPIQLTSETVQLEIPERFHVSHLMQGVFGLAEFWEHGDNPTYTKFLNELLPDVQWNITNEGHNMTRFSEGRGY